MRRRRLSLSLDALAFLREVAPSPETDPSAAATLADLAGADAVRLGLSEDLRPVRDSDVRDVRRAAASLELRLPPVPSLLKVALEAQPERVVLASEGREGPTAAGPLDFRAWGTALPPAVRTLKEAGIRVSALVAPDLASVKAAHGVDVQGVELFTGALLEFPGPDAHSGLEALSDAARLAEKLHLEVVVSGGLGFRSLEPVLAHAATASGVAVGRAFVSRALLVGVDRAVRDLRERIG